MKIFNNLDDVYELVGLMPPFLKVCKNFCTSVQKYEMQLVYIHGKFMHIYFLYTVFVVGFFFFFFHFQRKLVQIWLG